MSRRRPVREITNPPQRRYPVPAQLDAIRLSEIRGAAVANAVTAFFPPPLAALVGDYCKIPVDGPVSSRWTPVTESRPRSDLWISKYGGLPYLLRDDTYPCCSGCTAPLRLFVQLELGSLPAELSGAYSLNDGSSENDQLFQFFGCGHCTSTTPFGEGWSVRIVHRNQQKALSADEVLKRLHELGSLIRRKVAENESKPRKEQYHGDDWVMEADDFKEDDVIISWTRKNDYPACELEDGDGVEDKAYLLPNGIDVRSVLPVHPSKEPDVETHLYPEPLDMAEDQLSGWPVWFNGINWPQCPFCDAIMRMVIAVDSRTHIDVEFGEGVPIVVFQCPKHRQQFSAFWDCD